MPKKIPITLLCTVVITVFAWFVANEIVAQTSNLPTECTGGKYTLTFVEGPVTYTEAANHPDLDLITCTKYPCYLWHWMVVAPSDRDIQNLTGVTLLVENRPDNPMEFVGQHGGVKYLDCDAAHRNDWAEGICPDITIDVNTQVVVPGPGHIRLYVLTRSPQLGPISAAFHSGKTGGKVDNCFVYDADEYPIGGNTGPGYGLAPYAGVAYEDITRVKNTCIKIKRNPRTGCGFEIWYQVDCTGFWIQLDPIAGPQLDDVPVVECGNTRGIPDHCDECRVTAAASPGCTYMKLSGRWYKICY